RPRAPARRHLVRRPAPAPRHRREPRPRARRAPPRRADDGSRPHRARAARGRAETISRRAALHPLHDAQPGRSLAPRRPRAPHERRQAARHAPRFRPRATRRRVPPGGKRLKLLAHLAKDAKLLLRNRALLAALMLYPLLLVIVLGAAFQQPPQRLDLALVDHDAGDALEVNGRNVTAADILASGTGFAHVQKAASDAAGLALLRNGDVDALLIVPGRFLNNLGTLGSNATLKLVVDESDPLRAGVVKNAVQGVLDDFIKGVVGEKI